MATADFSSVDQYISAQPEAVRALLAKVRAAIRKAIPEADEIISYKIPAYRLPGGAAIYFAAWKKHYSLYPATDHVVSMLKEELAPYDVEKGTIRFPFERPVPVALIKRIATLRAEEVADKKVKAKPRSAKASR
jgi:uncharacterized protein YdhG (YjbR/CyaY superfamily)